MEKTINQVNHVITPAELLKHLQGHRELTRKTIEAFPENELFNFSIGGMRTFAEMVMELIGIAAPGLQEIVSGNPGELVEHFEHGNKKANILKEWDKATEQINRLFPQIASDRYHDMVMLFGKYENSVWSSIFYFVDNEIHHRGQGYVYLRSLGIEPPFFWDRP